MPLRTLSVQRMPLNLRHLFRGLLLAMVAALTTAAVLMSRADQWHPPGLVLVLFALALLGDNMTVTVKGQRLSAGFVTLMLATTLLGVAPALLMVAATEVADLARRRSTPVRFVASLVAVGASVWVAGVLIRAIVGDVHSPAHHHAMQSTTFGLTAFAVFISANTLNFLLVAVSVRLMRNRPIAAALREQFLPMLPSVAAAAALASLLATAYMNLGFPVLLALVLVLVIFQYLAVALARSEERAEQLEARTIRLASLQLGVLTTLVETLALRDRATARHAAAVARHARVLAKEAGLSETDQDLAHTAGLLHDIGRFALPDRILHAVSLTSQDRALVKRHPQEGAKLVGRLDGYGPVADAVLYHHERVDGTGYPAGLIGNEIPILSRVLAICEVYDTLTARDSYRAAMTPQDAIAELRRNAGQQLDAELVDVFIAILRRDGPPVDVEGDVPDFEAELEFERRARTIANIAA